MAQSAVKLSGNLEEADDNLLSWKSCMENYLVANDLWDVLNAHEPSADWKDRRRKNAAALYAIQSSCAPEVLSKLKGIKDAKLAWDYLVNMPKLHQLGQQLPLLDPQEFIFLSDLAAQLESETGVAQPPRPPPQLGGGAAVAPSPPQPLPLGGAREDPSPSPPPPGGAGVAPPPPPPPPLWPRPRGRPPALASPRGAAGVAPHSPPPLPPPPPPPLWPRPRPRLPPLAPGSIASLMLELKKSIYEGNLVGMRAILEQHPNLIRQKTPGSGQTALHFAAEGKYLAMVTELVDKMLEADMEIMNDEGLKPLEVAIASGSFAMVQCIHNKNRSVVQNRNPKGNIPLVYAVEHQASKNVVHFLYDVTPIGFLDPQNNSQGYKFITHCVRSHTFDVALHAFQRFPRQSTAAEDKHKWDALCALSQMPEVFRSGCRLVFWKRWIYSSLTVQPSGIASDGVVYISIPGHDSESRNTKRQGCKKMHDLKMTHLRSEEFLRIFIERMMTIDDGQWFKSNQLQDAWYLAIQFGVVEVVIQMIKKNPHLLNTVDTSGRGLFFHSILSRQENIFSLYYGLHEKLKYRSVSLTDHDGNTVLHMAAKLSPPSQLARISGAALRMQRELQWYKEVERIVTPAMRDKRNSDGKTAREVFTKTHKELVIEGEKWMKQTATSSTVVGAFIITTMFAAAFNAPGGSDKDTGLPRFLHERAFMIFMVSDAVSLFCGISSVLMFLGILSSRYSEEDFYIWLPTKMIIGISTLFFSIASMMVAFCAALVITLDRRWEAVIPIVLIAGIPLIFFVLLQFPLLIEIFKSTYGRGIFDKKMKPWY